MKSRSLFTFKLRSTDMYAILFGFLLWTAHLGKAYRFNGLPYPSMGPLEVLMARSSVLAVLVMGIIILLWAFSHRFTFPRSRSTAAHILFAMNAFLTLKLIFSSGLGFVGAAMTMLGATYLACILVPAGLADQKRSAKNDVSFIPLSIALYGVLLVVMNSIGLVLYPSGALNEVGRLHGTTTNPQALAMHCALVIPALIYCTRTKGNFVLPWQIYMATLPLAFFLLILTGSRMGLASAVIGGTIASVGLRVTLNLATNRKFLILASIGVAILMVTPLLDVIFARFVENRVDTRSQNWTWAWRQFADNPIFGMAPTGANGRYQFVENAWLAAISSGGMVLAFLCCAFIVTLTSEFRAVNVKETSIGLERDFYVASLATIFGISVFEAILLGILAPHTMIVYMICTGLAVFRRSIVQRKLQGEIL